MPEELMDLLNQILAAVIAWLQEFLGGILCDLGGECP